MRQLQSAAERETAASQCPIDPPRGLARGPARSGRAAARAARPRRVPVVRNGCSTPVEEPAAHGCSTPVEGARGTRLVHKSVAGRFEPSTAPPRRRSVRRPCGEIRPGGARRCRAPRRVRRHRTGCGQEELVALSAISRRRRERPTRDGEHHGHAVHRTDSIRACLRPRRRAVVQQRRGQTLGGPRAARGCCFMRLRALSARFELISCRARPQTREIRRAGAASDGHDPCTIASAAPWRCGRSQSAAAALRQSASRAV